MIFSVLSATDSYAQNSWLSKLFKKKVTVVKTETVKVDTAFHMNVSSPFFLAISPEIPDQICFCGQKIDLNKTDMRERFDREMMSMMYMHSSTLLLLKRANRFFPVIEPILRANGVPDDFKYLACIESNLDPRAVSSAKAVGMWQFMSETALQYGLEVSEDVDERYHVKKETEAACKYLKNANSKFKDWVTTAASYNAGTSRISKELERQKENTSFNLWLVEETNRYVFRILACKIFLENPKKYGFIIKKEQLYMPYVCKDTVISGKVSSWVDFAKDKGISFYDLKTYNLWIRNDSLENAGGKAYKVSIPLKQSLYFNKDNITVHQKNWAIDEN
jgi:membrane-bound lytic murein transglycosylase D